MTESEAIEKIRSCLGVNNIIMPYSDEMEAFGMAIEALEEIREYRALGTTRQIKDFIEDWRKFRELGNLEELSEAMEKQRAKKHKTIKPCKSVKYYSCPECDGLLSTNQKYCEFCGQVIDWGEEK